MTHIRGQLPSYAKGCGVVAVALVGTLLFVAPELYAVQADRIHAEPSADSISLTLAEAVDRALQNNPGFIRTRNNLELNTLERRERWLDILPTPQLALLNTNLNWTRQTTAEDPFGEPLPREGAEWVQTSRSSQGFGLNMSLDMAEVLGLWQQREQALGRELAVHSEAHQLRADVTRAFFELQERLAALELEKQLLRTATVNRDLARELYVLAIRDRIDLVTLELDVAEQEHALYETRAEAEAVRFALRNLIGDPDLPPFEIVSEELTVIDPAELDTEALVAFALSSSPAVLEAEANLRMEEREVSRVHAQWLPTLTMFWNRHRQDFVRGDEAFFDPNPDAAWDGSFGLAVSFPDLGQFFRRNVRRQRAEVAVANRGQTLRELRNQLEQDVRRVVSDLRSNVRSLEIQERRADLATERLELARAEYRLGNVSYLELHSAQTQAAQAGRQVLNARYSFQRARIELERTVGRPLTGLVQLRGEG